MIKELIEKEIEKKYQQDKIVRFENGKYLEDYISIDEVRLFLQTIAKEVAMGFKNYDKETRAELKIKCYGIQELADQIINEVIE